VREKKAVRNVVTKEISMLLLQKIPLHTKEEGRGTVLGVGVWVWG